MKSVYLHIPFCKQKCFYCDFNSYANYEEWIPQYMKALKQEIQRETIQEVSTIYVGGGTPSYLDAQYIQELLALLPPSEETTIEMNPGTVTREKLMIYQRAGINRISMGLQVADDNILKTIGRIHTVKDFEEAYQMTREVGFQNVNVDLMFGLPNQTVEIFKQSVEYLLTLKPEHFSAYSLILHQPIFENLPSDEEERAMYHYLVERMEEAGYHHYEISNFALPGYESKHNMAYWKQKEYFGFGAGASSFFENKRYTNLVKIPQYIKAIEENQEVRQLEETLDEESKLKEYMILGLRMVEGINIFEVNQKFHVDVEKKFAEEFYRLTQKGLLNVTDNICLTPKGLDFANLVWEEFI